MRRARAGNTRNKVRETGVSGYVRSGLIRSSRRAKNDLSVLDKNIRRYRRHWQRWHWDDCGRRSSSRDLAIGKSARAWRRNTVLHNRAAFKYVVSSPHGPHTGGEVWIEVTVED